MFTCSNCAPTALNARTAAAEKPHCGKSGVPFMYSTTGEEDSCDLMRSMTSTDLPRCLMRPGPAPLFGALTDQTLLLCAHTRPVGDLDERAAAADAYVTRIERADLDAGRFDSRSWSGWRRH